MDATVHPERGAFFDLSARTKLRLTGADRLRYLNGQISNDARKASDAAAVHACVLTQKGKINADVFIHCDGESFIVDSDADREELIARLDRYIIADDVQIADVTDEFALVHFLGEASDFGDARLVKSNRYGFDGRDLWIRKDAHDLYAQKLATQLSFCDGDCEEVFRIERGVPRWGRELSDEIIPTEANLEADVVDFAKGCYIGQEVISRIKMSGQTNKRLCGLITTAESPLRAGMRLTSSDAKEVGVITSAAKSSRIGAQIGLAFLKRGHQEAGTQLMAENAVAVQIAALPFI